MPRTKRDTTTKANGAPLGFEEKLWAAADKMRGHMDAAEDRDEYGRECLLGAEAGSLVVPASGCQVAYQSGRLIDEAMIEKENPTVLRDTLLPKLLSGEVRVKDAGKSMEEKR
jgi:hypothetical protein